MARLLASSGHYVAARQINFLFLVVASANRSDSRRKLPRNLAAIGSG